MPQRRRHNEEGGMNPAKNAPINLLPSHRWDALRQRQRMRSWMFVVAVYGLALAGAWGCWGLRSSLGAEMPQKQGTCLEQISAINGQIEKLHADRAAISTSMAEARRTLDAALAVGHHPDWSVLMDLLTAMGAPPNPTIVFEHVELQPRQAPVAKDGKAKPVTPSPQTSEIPDQYGYSLVLEGVAGSQVDVAKFAKVLQTLKLFESVSIVGTRPRDSVAVDAPGLHLVSFQISCTLSDAAAAAQTARQASTPKRAPAKNAPKKAGETKQ
jgi:Tfp pilus assembly protein PilN